MKVHNRIIALLLSLLMLSLCLCSCAGKDEAAPVTETPTATPQLQSYYDARITVLAEGDTYLGARACTDEGFYTVDYGHQAEGFSGPGISFVSYGGEKAQLEDFRPVQPPEELASQSDFYSSYELEGFAVDEDGSIVIVESLYMSWYSGPGQRNAEYGAIYDDFEQISFIRRLDADGNELSCAQLSLGEDESVFAYNMQLDSRGDIVLSQQNSLRFFSVDGNDMGRVELDGYVRTVLKGSDGAVMAVCYIDGGKELVCVVSPETMSVERSFSIPGGLMYLCPGDGEYELYYSDGFDFYGYSSASGESEYIFNWLACGVDVNTLSSVQVLDNGCVRAISNSYAGEGDDFDFVTELVEVSLHQSPEIPTYISLGCISADAELSSAIMDFNRGSADCRIQLMEYYLDYELSIGDQMELLVARLMQRQMPDILMLDGFNHALMASAGLFADLQPYLEAEGGLEREDFFTNVLESCEQGGKLYAIADVFSVDSVLADAALVGEEPGWSYEQYYQALAAMGEGCDPFESYTSAQELLRSLLAMELASYIDWEKLTADLQNDSFIGILEFTDDFPYSFDWDNYQWSDADIVDYRIAGGRQMLLRSSLLNAEEMLYNSLYFDGNVAYKGYPTADGSVGNTLTLRRICAVSEASEHKAEAWRFISFLLERDKMEYGWGFPSLTARFESQLEKLTEPRYLEDEQHQPVLTEEGEQIELPQGHTGTVLGVRSFYSLDPEKRSQLERVLTGCEKLRLEDDLMIELVVDTVRPYYEGALEAEAAAAEAERALDEYLSHFK